MPCRDDETYEVMKSCLTSSYFIPHSLSLSACSQACLIWPLYGYRVCRMKTTGNNKQQQQQQKLYAAHIFIIPRHKSRRAAPRRAVCLLRFLALALFCWPCEKERRGGGGGKKERKRSVAWHSMPLPAHWVACRARARVNFLSYLLARHLCQGRKVILCCLLSFCCCFSPILLLLFLRSTWNHKCSRCWCHRCRRCWWRLTRPEVVQNLKRKSIVREQAQWPPEPEPEPEAAAAAWPLDAIFGHNDITRSHIHMRAHTHTHTNSHTRHTRYAFFVVFYWVIGAFICHTPHARFMPAMCHVAKTNSCLSVLLSLCPSVRLSFRPASQPDSQ